MDNWLVLLFGFLGSGTAGIIIASFLNKRQNKANARKVEAEAASEETDAIAKLQDRNTELYERVVKLEKEATEKDRTIENLKDRLTERDTQIATYNKQFERLSKLAEQAPIIQTLQNVLDGTKGTIETLQKAVDQGQSLLQQQIEANKGLQDTNRDLVLRKPDGTASQ